MKNIIRGAGFGIGFAIGFGGVIALTSILAARTVRKDVDSLMGVMFGGTEASHGPVSEDPDNQMCRCGVVH